MDRGTLRPRPRTRAVSPGGDTLGAGDFFSPLLEAEGPLILIPPRQSPGYLPSLGRHRGEEETGGCRRPGRMPRGRVAQGMLKSSGAAGGPRDAGAGEGGVPVFPLGNPTPRSNVGRLSLHPPPPPYSAPRSTSEPPPQHPALLPE